MESSGFSNNGSPLSALISVCSISFANRAYWFLLVDRFMETGVLIGDLIFHPDAVLELQLVFWSLCLQWSCHQCCIDVCLKCPLKRLGIELILESVPVDRTGGGYFDCYYWDWLIQV